MWNQALLGPKGTGIGRAFPDPGSRLSLIKGAVDDKNTA
jgi:hypothetical protein